MKTKTILICLFSIISCNLDAINSFCDFSWLFTRQQTPLGELLESERAFYKQSIVVIKDNPTKERAQHAYLRTLCATAMNLQKTNDLKNNPSQIIKQAKKAAGQAHFTAYKKTDMLSGLQQEFITIEKQRAEKEQQRRATQQREADIDRLAMIITNELLQRRATNRQIERQATIVRPSTIRIPYQNPQRRA